MKQHTFASLGVRAEEAADPQREVLIRNGTPHAVGEVNGGNSASLSERRSARG